jgi:hypothetical protein
MKYFLVVLSLSLLSCAHPKKEFKKEVNCSEKALEYHYKESAKVNAKRSEKIAVPSETQLLNLFGDYNNKMSSCYDQHVLHKGFRDSYNVCTIIKVDENSQVDYVYIDDAAQGMDEKFRQCMNDEIKAIDFSSIGAKEIVILQPFNFYSVR